METARSTSPTTPWATPSATATTSCSKALGSPTAAVSSRFGRRSAISTGTGRPARVRVYPQPVQAEMPVWVTSGGSPDTFRDGRCCRRRRAHEPPWAVPGRSGAEDRGVPSGGRGQRRRVVSRRCGPDDPRVPGRRRRPRAGVREPFCAYPRSSFALIAGSVLGDDKLDPASVDPRRHRLPGQAVVRPLLRDERPVRHARDGGGDPRPGGRDADRRDRVPDRLRRGPVEAAAARQSGGGATIA